ncbi:MAG: hypothetical protein K2Q14_05670 [Gammaproteobacteria bacterium]|nr:hypothetical protein [Gammaproteobacteria bacterium]
MNLKLLLEQIFYRLGNKASVLFSMDDIAEWPSSFVKVLKDSNILKQSSPGNSTICRGCEENCFMPVEIFPEADNRPARAFISCDKRDDIGRIPVDLERLKQWKISMEALATALANLLQITNPTIRLTDGNKWHLGTLKGKKQNHQSPVFLFYENEMLLSISGHLIPLLNVITFTQDQLILDKSTLVYCIDHPLGKAETTENRRNRLYLRVQEEKRKGTRAFLQVVANEEGINKSRLQQILKSMPLASCKKITASNLLPIPVL